MRATYRRGQSNASYWDRRWTEAGQDAPAFADLEIYPIKYARMVLRTPEERALELGCGLGRVVKHYHREGWRITGVERSAVAVAQIKRDDPTLDVVRGDVRHLPFEDGTFDVVLAFGVYHNLPSGLDAALHETARCLRPGGRFCISMRPDNLEMRVNELYWRWRHRRRPGAMNFHKWHVTSDEFIRTMHRHDLHTTSVHHARNMSLLYRLPWLRDSGDAHATEGDRRASGYRLNRAGAALDQRLMQVAAAHVCNVMVFIGSRAGGP